MARLVDHLIFVTEGPDQSLETFRGLGFNVINFGGAHADGITGNCILPLTDGVYIELLHFYKRGTQHRWDLKKLGWADWALMPPPETLQQYTDRINATGPLQFAQPVYKSRQSPEHLIEWNMTTPIVPREQVGRPCFACQDISPREWRVPKQDKPHPNSTTGLKGITLLSHPGKQQDYINTLETIWGSKSLTSNEGKFKAITPGGTSFEIILREPQNKKEEEWVKERGEGLYEIQLEADGDKDLGNGIVLRKK